MSKKDLYSVLGVSSAADQAAIQGAYRALMRRYHPDVGTERDTARAQQVNEAYEVLGDPDKRRRYDARRHPSPAWDPQGRRRDSAPARTSEARPSSAMPAGEDAGSGMSGSAAGWWFAAFCLTLAALLYVTP